MKEKKPFVANKNHFYIFSGLLLCLLSVILCLNTGIVARYASTPFTYAFGSVSYLIYLALNVIGLRLIFAKKFFKIKFNIFLLASIVLIIAGALFYAHFTAVDKNLFITLSDNTETGSISAFNAYNDIFNQVDGGYYKVTFLALIIYPFASGIIGYFLLGASNQLFGINNGGLIIAIILASISLILFFLPLILKLIGQNKQKVQPEEKEEKETVSDISEQKQNQQKVKNIDVVKHASEIDPENYESEIMGVPKRSATMSSPTFVQQDSGANNFSISDNGMFVPAKFVSGENGQYQQQTVEENVSLEETPAQDEQPIIEETNEQQEQLELDFDAKPEINTELAGAKPVFEEPVTINQPAPQQVQPVQPKVENKPKRKERVK